MTDRIRTRCPACGHETLLIGTGGHLTCSWLKCPNPSFDDAREAAERRALREATKTGFYAGFQAANSLNVADAWEAAPVRKAHDEREAATT